MRPIRYRDLPLALGALQLLSLLAAPAAAGSFTIEVLVLEGTDVPGVGLVTSIDNLAINDDGTWLVEADTDHPDTDADAVLLRDGVLFLREGDPLTAPAGATLGSFDTVNLNALGNSGWNFFLDDTAGLSDDSGLYFNTGLLIQEGEFSTAPSLSPGTPYLGFFEAKINDLDEIVLVATVDDPAIDSTVDQVLVRVLVNVVGNLAGEEVIAKEGDLLPGQTEPVEDFATGPHGFDANNLGQVMFAADLAGDTAVDDAIYIDDALVAQEGGPSPVAGRAWASLSSPELSLNQPGGHVYSGTLEGDTATDLLIVRDGAKLVQEGDSPAAISPFLLTSFGSGPILLDDSGRVLWYGDWDDPDTDRDTGLFLDDELLVQEGVTVIAGLLVDTLRGVQDGYAMSDDGDLILFEAQLEGGIDGAFLIRRQEGLALAEPVPGLAGQVNQFAISGATPGATVALAAGVADGLTPVPGCPGQALLIGGPTPLGTVVADADGNATLARAVPPAAGGRTLRFQAVEFSSCTVGDLVTFTFP